MTRLALILFVLSTTPIVSPNQARAKASYGRLTIRVVPSGAKIRLGRRVYDAPTRLWLRRGKGYTLRVTKPGYLPKTLDITISRPRKTLNIKLAIAQSTLIVLPGDTGSQGAMVYLDGQPTQPLPATLTHPPGRVAVETRKPGYTSDRRWVSLLPGKQKTLTISLHAKRGRLFVSSVPAGASVFLDETRRGTTPLLIDPVSSGRHLLKLSLPHRRTLVQLVSIKPDETTKIALSWKTRAGKVPTKAILQVLADPKGSDVYVDGTFAGKAPYRRDDLAPGTHHIAVKWPGYRTAEHLVTLTGGKVSTLKLHLTRNAPSPHPHASLKTASGRAHLIVVSSLRGATVSLDGAPVGRTPYARANLKVGPHLIKVSAPGFLPLEKRFSLAEGETHRITAVLQPRAPRCPQAAIASTKTISTRESKPLHETRATSAFGADLVPPHAFTSALSLGFPHLVAARLTTGIFSTHHLALDLGVALRSYGVITEGAFRGRLRLFRYQPLALAFTSEIGAGGGPGGRNTFFLKAGLSASLRFKDLVTVTTSLQGDITSDRLCASSQQDDEPEVCTFPPDDLSFSEVRGRFFGARLMLSATAEVAYSPSINLFAQLSGAPFQSQRRAYTDAFSSYMPKNDPLIYGRIGVVLKF